MLQQFEAAAAAVAIQQTANAASLTPDSLVTLLWLPLCERSSGCCSWDDPLAATLGMILWLLHLTELSLDLLFWWETN